MQVGVFVAFLHFYVLLVFNLVIVQWYTKYDKLLDQFDPSHTESEFDVELSLRTELPNSPAAP